MAPIRKVFAYITHGDEIVVFEEPDFPEAGTQVPGGTLRLRWVKLANVPPLCAELDRMLASLSQAQ